MQYTLDAEVTIELTSECNLNCSYCYISESQRGKTIHEARVGAKAVAQCELINAKMKESEIILEYVVLLSSEPTIMSAIDLANCINIIAKRVNNVVMITNGVRLANETYYKTLFENLLDDTALTICVSIDGYKEIHDKTRDNSYDLAYSTMIKLHEDDRLCRVNTVVGLAAANNSERFKEWYTTEIMDRGIYCIASCVEPPIELTTKERMPIMKLIRDIKDMEGKTREEPTSCQDIHIALDGTVTQCTNGCNSNVDKQASLLVHRLDDIIGSRSLHSKKINADCLECDSSHICNVHCHFHSTKNGYAFNCVYGKK